MKTPAKLQKVGLGQIGPPCPPQEVKKYETMTACRKIIKNIMTKEVVSSRGVVRK